MVDDAFKWRMTAHDREIGLEHLMVFELRGESGAGRRVEGEQQNTRGAPVKPMCGIDATADLVAQALQDKTLFMARHGSAMYQPARRLVNGDQIVVAVQDGKGLGEVVQSEKTRAWQSLRV